MRDLCHLELDKGMRCVSSGMESSEEFLGLIFLPIGDEPSIVVTLALNTL
jgi:hypothetical protein